MEQHICVLATQFPLSLLLQHIHPMHPSMPWIGITQVSKGPHSHSPSWIQLRSAVIVIQEVSVRRDNVDDGTYTHSPSLLPDHIGEYWQQEKCIAQTFCFLHCWRCALGGGQARGNTSVFTSGSLLFQHWDPDSQSYLRRKQLEGLAEIMTDCVHAVRFTQHLYSKNFEPMPKIQGCVQCLFISQYFEPFTEKHEPGKQVPG